MHGTILVSPRDASSARPIEGARQVQAKGQPMTARDELIQAAASLESKGQQTFSPAELIAEARRRGARYPDSTLRTQITSGLRTDQGIAARGQGLVRVDRGEYRLDSAGASTAPPVRRPRIPTPRADLPPPPEDAAHRYWFWEGNVQDAVVRMLTADGWSIVRVADTRTKEAGVDVEARRGHEHLLIEVKGYPSTIYSSGPKKGQPKPTGTATQARTYFAGALLTGMLMRSGNPDARVVLAFPAFSTFETLAGRILDPATRAGLEVWLVTESGEVRGAHTP
ncbi:DUF7669 domain-containing protein [Rhabdothermincola salaria]|uniref:DUF7669 domain-containing protein n=1 Tax=Rhabdothermincola salaria TaxID=2903142 RepID=UPI001E4DE5B6|nr:hypothetical protein [Rhabdothermincola salaria]MCD9623937.1 hypothetical protein [Rhabdothermincola salaria]